MKFKRSSIATTGAGELVDMAWQCKPWTIIMRFCRGQGTGTNYEKSMYVIALKHSTVIDHTLELPKLYVWTRTMAIMAVMWLVNRLSQVCDEDGSDMDIHWRQLLRDLSGNDDACDGDGAVFVGADHVCRAYRQIQELKRERSV